MSNSGRNWIEEKIPEMKSNNEMIVQQLKDYSDEFFQALSYFNSAVDYQSGHSFKERYHIDHSVPNNEYLGC